jgi:2'-5' RNA ligase
MRLFVAVWPSPEVLDVLADLPRPSNPAVRWVPLDRLHVTLRFLGDVTDETVTGVGDVLREVASARSPRRVELGPSTARLGQGVLMVPVTGLDDLGRAVSEATDSFATPPPDGPFVGHLTLARGRNRRAIPTHLAGGRVEARWTVSQLTLVRSRLGSGGPQYEVLATMRLRGDPHALSP